MNPPPVLPPDVRRRLAVAADRLTMAVEWPEPLSEDRGPASARWHAQSLSRGAAGIALLHALRNDADRTRAWVRAATGAELAGGGNAGLWYGAASVAFALRHGAPTTYAPALARLDQAVDRLVRTRLAQARTRIEAGRYPARAEYDVVLGLSGLGSYLLHRNPDDLLLGEVLAFLVELTRLLPAPDHGTRPGWWTDVAPPGKDPSLFAGGCADLGAAHGITGPLSLLSLAHRHGTTVPGQLDAIATIAAWLERHRQDGRTGGWWPERITATELAAGHLDQDGPRRPSWCYGTPGITRALQLAALALGDTAMQDRAETDLAACLADSAQTGTFTGPGLCHGWAGAVMTLWCALGDARSPDLVDQLLPLVEGFLRDLPDPAADTTPLGLIAGLAGAGATAHTLAHPTDPAWASCLLIT